MKSLIDYIIEKSSKDDKESLPFDPADIKFTIWKGAKNQVKWLNDDDEDFTKISYTYEDDKKGVEIQFLLGKQFNDDNPTIWQLWCGKLGSIGYDEDPYCSLNTDKFADAINLSIEKITEILKKIYDNPQDWIQYYKEI